EHLRRLREHSDEASAIDPRDHLADLLGQRRIELRVRDDPPRFISRTCSRPDGMQAGPTRVVRPAADPLSMVQAGTGHFDEVGKPALLGASHGVGGFEDGDGIRQARSPRHLWYSAKNWRLDPTPSFL